MGYKIDYGRGVHYIQHQPAEKRNAGHWGSMLVLLMITGSVLLFSLKAAGFNWYWFLPGDETITKVALSEFVSDLSEGIQFKDAITAFCTEIIDGARLE